MGQNRSVLVSDADAAAEIAMAAASVAVSNALHAGARVPAFVLADKQGKRVSLERLLGSGPVVLYFLRGSWCTFSEESLAQLAALHAQIVAAGAQAVAIAPPDHASRHSDALPVPELVDVDLKVTRAFGLTFELPPELHRRYLQLGYVPPRTRKTGGFLVPVPATYLVDQNGIVVFACVDVDYRHGIESGSLLTALHALRARVTENKRVDAVR